MKSVFSKVTRGGLFLAVGSSLGDSLADQILHNLIFCQGVELVKGLVRMVEAFNLIEFFAVASLFGWLSFSGLNESKISGVKNKNENALLDDETRYWIAKEVAGEKFSREAVEYASNLFRRGKQVAGKKPLTIITDGLHAYHQACKREFFTHNKPQTQHAQHVTWRAGSEDNRKMEAFNGTVRSREKVMRSLKREDSPILEGYQIFHNYVRPHMALGGKTPAELVE